MIAAQLGELGGIEVDGDLMKYAAPSGPRIAEALLDDPLLLRTPIVRDGAEATIGYQPEVWTAWR